MKIELANPKDESRLKQVLSDCELPNKDITPDHLDNFLILRDDDRIAGVVGLEIFGKCALLRSLAVTQSNRAKGSATSVTRWCFGVRTGAIRAKEKDYAEYRCGYF